MKNYSNEKLTSFVGMHGSKQWELMSDFDSINLKHYNHSSESVKKKC